MHDIPDDELISAYLDGEVTDDERRYVERLLADRPEYRKLFDELQALGGQLRAAPRYELGDRFYRRVLRRAERHMLAGEPSNEAAAASGVPPVAPAPDDAPPRQSSSPSPVLPIETGRRAVRANRNWRRYGWAAMAAAAGLLIMFFGGPGPETGPTQVAQAPHVAPPSSPTGPRGGDLPNIASSNIASSNMASSNIAGPSPSASADAGSTAGSALDAPAANRPIAPTEPTLAQETETTTPAGSESLGESTRPAPEAIAESSPPNGNATLDRASSGGRSAGEPAGLAADSDAGSAASSTSVATTAASPETTDSATEPGSGETPLPALKGDELVVVVEVARKEFDEQALDQVLESEGIHFDDDSKPASESFDVIYVEATPMQVEAALRGLAAKPNRFPTLAVVPADDAERGEAWRQYERGDVSISAPAAASHENRADYMRGLALGVVAERRAHATEAARQAEQFAAAERAAQNALGPDGKSVPRLARAAQSARPPKPGPAAQALPTALEKAARRVSRAQRFGSSPPAEASATTDPARSPSPSDVRRAEMIEGAQQRAVFLVRVLPATAP